MCVSLTPSDLDWPDEDGAKGQSCDDGNASRYNDHDVMVEPHTGRTAHHSADTHTHTQKSLLSGWVLFKYTHVCVLTAQSLDVCTCNCFKINRFDMFTVSI